MTTTTSWNSTTSITISSTVMKLKMRKSSRWSSQP